MAVLHVNEDNFEQEILQYEGLVLVDFWASWCGPCQMLGPIVEMVEQEREDVKVCKIDVDSNPNLAAKFKVVSIPMLYVFKNGEVKNRSVGVISKNDILELLK